MAVNNIGVDKKELNESLDTKLAGFVPSGGTGLTAAESTKLNEIHTRQGVDTDTDTSLTLFGRLKQLYNHTTATAGLYPTKFFRGFVSVDVAQNVYVVVANVTSGKGFLSYVGVNYPNSGVIMVTIDGVVTNITSNNVDMKNTSPAIYVYHFNVYFNTSLRVEITDTSTSPAVITAVAHYNLV